MSDTITFHTNYDAHGFQPGQIVRYAGAWTKPSERYVVTDIRNGLDGGAVVTVRVMSLWERFVYLVTAPLRRLRSWWSLR